MSILRKPTRPDTQIVPRKDNQHNTAPRYIFAGEKLFRKHLKKAAGELIPAGFIPEIRPSFQTTAVSLAYETDLLRQIDQRNGNPAHAQQVESSPK